MAALDGGVGALALASGMNAIAIVAVQSGSCRRARRFGGRALRRNDHAVGPDVQAAGHRRDFRRRHRSATDRRRDSPEHPRGLHRVGGQSEERRARLSSDRRGGPCPRTAAGVRQHGADAGAVSPVRPRHRHRRLQRDEVYRRPRHEHRRGDRRQRAFRLDESSRRGGRSSPRPIRRITAWCSTRLWAVVLHHDLPHALAARSRRCVEPDERLPVPARARNAPSADAAPLRERLGRGEASSKRIRWSVG